MQQSAANPYQTPGAPVADQGAEDFSEVKVFSAAGRIGRVRYIGYSVGMTLVFYALIAAGAGLSAAAGAQMLGIVIIGAAVIGMVVIGIMLTIQRCHDFDASGWLSLLVIVPLVPLMFWIIPGSKGSNRFGAPTPPNSTGVVVLALIFPFLFVAGIVAAVALPAYQSYTDRARTAQELQQQSQTQEEALDQDTDDADAGYEAADEGSGDEPAQAEAQQSDETR